MPFLKIIKSNVGHFKDLYGLFYFILIVACILVLKGSIVNVVDF